MKISFNYDGKEFLISCGIASGKEEIYINSRLVSQKKNFIHLKSLHSFNFEGSPYEARLELNILQGVVSVTLLRSSQVVYSQDFNMRGKAFSTIKISIPKWSYIFIVLCGIIPFISLGGAVPAVLGIGGASICLAISRKSRMPTVLRVFLCIVITILCWVLFFILIALMQSLKKP